MQILERCPPPPPGAAPARIGTELVLRVLLGERLKSTVGRSGCRARCSASRGLPAACLADKPFALLPFCHFFCCLEMLEDFLDSAHFLLVLGLRRHRQALCRIGEKVVSGWHDSFVVEVQVI